MATRNASLFSCTACGHDAQKWFGRCPACGAWGSADAAGRRPAAVTTLEEVPEGPERIPTGVGEVDRVLGGGLVAGQVVLLAGEPGVGKSTLVLQVLDALGGRGGRCLLLTGEESVGQVALRARRLGIGGGRLRVAACTSLADTLAACAAEVPDVVVVDSIQTLHDDALDHQAGSQTQVRACAAALVRTAKATGTAFVLVGHVTKDGAVAGPKTLEHVVDAVLTLDGERHGSVRVLRAGKNRFGSCEEAGVFVMGARGLEAVTDPSAMLLADRTAGVSGSVVFCGLEGTRPLLVEMQALVNDTEAAQPRRVASGFDPRRLALLLGVLHRRAGVAFGRRDVFAAAAGGIAVREPAADLAVCLALFSAAFDAAVPAEMVAFGEVGLAGEVRRVPGLERRLAEAARCGFEVAIAPRGATRVPPGLKVVEVARLSAALAQIGGAMPVTTGGRATLGC